MCLATGNGTKCSAPAGLIITRFIMNGSVGTQMRFLVFVRNNGVNQTIPGKFVIFRDDSIEIYKNQLNTWFKNVASYGMSGYQTITFAKIFS